MLVTSTARLLSVYHLQSVRSSRIDLNYWRYDVISSRRATSLTATQAPRRDEVPVDARFADSANALLREYLSTSFLGLCPVDS